MSDPGRDTADVVVLGFGSAGVAAALTAARAGASVLVLEKQPADRHTPTAKASASLVLHAEDEAAAAEYFAACAGGLVPGEVTDAWARFAADLGDWLAGTLPEAGAVEATGMHAGAAHAGLPGAAGVRSRWYSLPGTRPRSGAAFYLALQQAALREGVRVRWGARAGRVLRDDAGAVTGVGAVCGDGAGILVEAPAVILATGGFDADEQLKAAFLPAHPMHFAGNPGNTGDGLRMAIACGAGLWHMSGAEGRHCTHFPAPDGGSLNFQLTLLPGGFVVVDGAGRRFCDEYRYTRIHTLWYELLAFDAESRSHPRIPAYWIFDRRRIEAGPLASPLIGPGGMGLYDWSADNSAEVASGWIERADTVAGLAARLGFAEPELLERAVTGYNAACTGGGADEVGRSEGMIALDAPPFYAVPLYPGGVGTSGGPRHDGRGRVIDVSGAPIPGLFSAGSVGQMIGQLYPGPGSGWSEALCAGRMAGAAAAELRGCRRA